MTRLAKGIVLQISLAALALAQQRAKPRTHIICTPPNLTIVKMVRPVFPHATKTKHVFGKVAVRAEIDKTGTPSKVTVSTEIPTSLRP